MKVICEFKDFLGECFSGYCGENLAESIVWHDDYKRPSGEEVTLMWYNEGTDYNYEAAQFDPDAGSGYTDILGLICSIVYRYMAVFGLPKALQEFGST